MQEADPDDAERTQFRRPNWPPATADNPDQIVHLLRVQSATQPPVRLGPGSMTVGRQEGCDLVLKGTDVSRRHCRFDLVGGEVLAGGEVLVSDLNSTNGTRVNGATIRERVLSDGDQIVIGTTVLRFETS